MLTDLQRSGQSIITLAGAGPSAELSGLPPTTQGVFDPLWRWHVYYHSHAGPLDEAGHFHTLRRFGDRAIHVVGISIDHAGWPQALFTLNHWCVGDGYEPAARIKGYARRFRLDSCSGDPRLIRFLSLLFEAFLGEIEWLQDEKVYALTAHYVRHPDGNLFEDRSVEITSRVNLCLAADCQHSGQSALIADTGRGV
jgi:hypothetical protein